MAKRLKKTRIKQGLPEPDQDQLLYVKHRSLTDDPLEQFVVDVTARPDGPTRTVAALQVATVRQFDRESENWTPKQKLPQTKETVEHVGGRMLQ